MNSFGRRFRLSIFGESHGKAVGVVLDGVPCGMELTENDFEADISRRRSGAMGTTSRREKDRVLVISGLYDGFTTGAPMALMFENGDTMSNDYTQLVNHPRPSHADLVAHLKYEGFNDPRGGGHFSGRLTLPLVAAGVVAKKMLPKEVEVRAEVVKIAGFDSPQEMRRAVEQAVADGDSVGGIVECRVRGLKIGIGEPFFDSLESLISHILFAIPGVKGVEFGSGFEAAKMMGSVHNDMIINAQGTTSTNHAGGIVAGLTNGNELVVRVAIKPTASIAKGQKSYNFETLQEQELRIKGRHDGCIALRAAVVVEAAVAVVLADLI